MTSKTFLYIALAIVFLGIWFGLWNFYKEQEIFALEDVISKLNINISGLNNTIKSQESQINISNTERDECIKDFRRVTKESVNKVEIMFTSYQINKHHLLLNRENVNCRYHDVNDDWSLSLGKIVWYQQIYKWDLGHYSLNYIIEYEWTKWTDFDNYRELCHISDLILDNFPLY